MLFPLLFFQYRLKPSGPETSPDFTYQERVVAGDKLNDMTDEEWEDVFCSQGVVFARTLPHPVCPISGVHNTFVFFFLAPIRAKKTPLPQTEARHVETASDVPLLQRGK